MKITTKFGIGEIVIHKFGKRDVDEELLEVIAIHVERDFVRYVCRYPKGIVSAFREDQLQGDPDYDQEKGCYPS